MIWFLILVISVLVVLSLVMPFMRHKLSKSSKGLGAFSGQLEELARDRDLELISKSEARTAELEIKRRLLSASSSVEDDGPPAKVLRQFSIIMISMSVLAAVSLYLLMGSPHLIGAQPVVSQSSEMPSELQEVIAEIDALALQLMDSPDNPEGWVVLGQSYMALRRYREASIAFENAIGLIGDDAVLFASLGQAHLFAEQGRMTPIAREAFARALDVDPQNLRARFFMAEALYQSGDIETALSNWRDLLADGSIDDNNRAMIQGRLDAAIRDQGASSD